MNWYGLTLVVHGTTKRCNFVRAADIRFCSYQGIVIPRNTKAVRERGEILCAPVSNTCWWSWGSENNTILSSPSIAGRFAKFETKHKYNTVPITGVATSSLGTACRKVWELCFNLIGLSQLSITAGGGRQRKQAPSAAIVLDVVTKLPRPSNSEHEEIQFHVLMAVLKSSHGSNG